MAGKMNRRDFLKCAGGAAAVTCFLPLASSAATEGGQQPNVFLFISDDQTWIHNGCYGAEDVKTPNIDRLREQGLKFEQCFTGASVCSPSRHQIYTGLHGVRSGGYPNHSVVYPGTRSVVHHLRALGYRVGIARKRHVGPYPAYPFESVTPWSEFDFDAMAAFINRSDEEPYFLSACSTQPHKPWDVGDAGRYPPDELTVPPYLADTAETRDWLSRYYAEITYMDQEVGRCLELVQQSGKAENTIFIFTSEQGASMPHCKGTCYDTGQHTAFLVRWPGVTEPGGSTGTMIQYVDLLPTLIEAAGGNPEGAKTGRGRGFDGSSFLPVLRGEADGHRDYVYLMHTSGRKHRSLEECFPIRAVRTDRYKYIMNLHPQGFQGNVPESWARKAKTDDHARHLVETYWNRPAEELYDLVEDPYELNNVADRPEHEALKEELAEKIKAWMRQQGDRGIETDVGASERQPTGSGGVWRIGRNWGT